MLYANNSAACAVQVDVLATLQRGVWINMLGLGSTLVGLQVGCGGCNTVLTRLANSMRDGWSAAGSEETTRHLHTIRRRRSHTACGGLPCHMLLRGASRPVF